MKPAPARLAWVSAALIALGGAAQAGCELVLTDHRGDRKLARWELPQAPRFTIRFTHSVLRTSVRDTYEMRRHPQGWRAHLLEERFDGEGYGLPHAALGPGESLHPTQTGWLLRLNRPVDPLVVRPTPEQDAWLEVGGRSVRLLDLGRVPMLVTLDRCPAD